ncbi:hypothetical protein GBAR_LOCUS29146, partial [Geodia barretti]
VARPRTCRIHSVRRARSDDGGAVKFRALLYRADAPRRKETTRSSGAAADARLPQQGRRHRGGDGREARRLQPQSGDGAAPLYRGEARRALLPLAPPARHGEAPRSLHLHQVRRHGGPRRGAPRDPAGDGRSALGGRGLLKHRRASTPAPEYRHERTMREVDALRHAGRVRRVRAAGLRQGYF